MLNSNTRKYLNVCKQINSDNLFKNKVNDKLFTNK